MSQLTKSKVSGTSLLGIIGIHLWLGFTAGASSLQLVSTADPALGSAAGGGGDSYLPVISRDGRFVLFASTADNLVRIGANRPMPTLIPSPINVFLRDRTSGSTVLISANLNATGGGNADSLPMGISTNGRYALFESTASDLVAGDTNNANDVFVRDVLSGTTFLVSASTNGGFADNASYSSTMTPDGRYVAFASAADNLILDDTNGIPDLFVRDVANNVTTLVSVGAQAGSSPYSDVGSDAPVLTPDGRYVAFYSTAAGLVPGVATIGNVYLRDLVSGITTWASSGALAALQTLFPATNAVSFNHALSEDGRFIAFEASTYLQPSTSVILRYDSQTGHTDLIETNANAPLTTGYQDIQDLAMTPDGRFVAYVANAIDTSGTTTAIRLWDAQSNAGILASGDTNGTVLAGSLSDLPSIDDNGRFVVFLSSATDLVTNDLVGDFHLYARDILAGTTTLVDTDTNGVGSPIDPVTASALSSDGRFVAFDCLDGDLVPLDRNHAYDVFVRNLPAASTELVSIHDAELPSFSPDGPSAISISSVSFDARYIAFWSEADDLVANDGNGLRDVYVRDSTIGTNLLASIGTNGVAGDGLSTDPAISGDGRYVAFTSLADNLVTGDTNNAQDVFVRDLQAGMTTLVSVNAAGTGPGNADSFSPLLSSNGQFVSFHSRAGNLTPGMTLGTENLFWRDRQSQLTYALTTNGVTSAAMTPDGRLVTYITSATRISPASDRLYVWDSTSKSAVYSLLGSGTQTNYGAVTISADGKKIAYVCNTVGQRQLWITDWGANTNWAVVPLQTPANPDLKFSSDGRFLAYLGTAASSPPDATQVYLYDLLTGTNLLVSAGFDGVSAGNDNSDSVDLSSDGRFVTFRSAASNLVPDDTNGVPDVFLYDSLNSATTLLTASRFGNASADNRSLTPVFSGDGRTLLFVSWASDLIPDDFNNNADVFEFSLYSNAEIPSFSITALPATTPSPGNWLSWPVVAGKFYHVQFKDNLEDPVWHELNGVTSITGNQASLKDGTVSVPQRFYRIVAH